MSKMIVEEHHNAKLRVSNYTDSQGFSIGACFIIELNDKINKESEEADDSFDDDMFF